MKRTLFLFSIGVWLATVSVFPALAQEKVWVASQGATLKADKTASSETVEQLPLGAELKVMSIDSKWYKVSALSGKTGWVYRGKVSTTPPVSDKKGGGGFLGNLPGTQIRADSSDTARSIRGLSPEAKEYADSTGKPQEYRKALDQVLAVKTGRSEVESFLKNGKIGEYAQ